MLSKMYLYFKINQLIKLIKMIRVGVKCSANVSKPEEEDLKSTGKTFQLYWDQSQREISHTLVSTMTIGATMVSIGGRADVVGVAVIYAPVTYCTVSQCYSRTSLLTALTRGLDSKRWVGDYNKNATTNLYRDSFIIA